MGKLLSSSQASKNYLLLHGLRENFFSSGGKKQVSSVVVYKENKKMFSFKNQDILLSKNRNYSHGSNRSEWIDVQIFWEDYGIGDYKSFGLYGYYSSDYNKMNYENSCHKLTIYGDNNITIDIFL